MQPLIELNFVFYQFLSILLKVLIEIEILHLKQKKEK